MSNYTKLVDYAAKDALASGNAAKIIKGTEIGAEFDAIATAIATKADTTYVDAAVAGINDFTTYPVVVGYLDSRTFSDSNFYQLANLGTPAINTGSGWSTVNSEFTVPADQAGTYQIHINVTGSPAASETMQVYLSVYKNGVENTRKVATFKTAGEAYSVPLVHAVSLAVGDKLAFYGKRNSGTSTLTFGASDFTIFRLR